MEEEEEEKDDDGNGVEVEVECHMTTYRSLCLYLSNALHFQILFPRNSTGDLGQQGYGLIHPGFLL